MAQVNPNIFIGIPGLVHVFISLSNTWIFGKAFCERTRKSTDEEQIKGAVTVLKKALWFLFEQMLMKAHFLVALEL